MATYRSIERVEFLSDLGLQACYHNGYGFPQVEWSTDPGSNLPFRADITDRYVDDPEDPEYMSVYRVTIDLMARGVNRILSDHTHQLINDIDRKRIQRASKYNDASDMDVVDCLAILEIAVFGRVVYC